MQFGIERASGIGLRFAFDPLFSDTEIKRPRQDHGRAPLVGMPMRHDFGSKWELGSLNVHTWFGWVTVQYSVLRSGADRRFKLYFIRKFKDRLVALGVSCHRKSCDER